jgi:hypothetical protein
MQETDLSSIVEQLREEEGRLGDQQAELKDRLACVETDLKRVRGALSALGEKPVTKSGGKPAATKKEVIQVIADVLQSQGTVEKEALRQSVEARLAEKGKSRQGLALRFEEALKDHRFVDTPGGYRLASESQAEQATSSELYSVRSS